MAKTGDLSKMAQAGYDAGEDDKCPYYDSSPNGMAWLAGQYFRTQGLPRPTSASMSRGYVVNVDERKVNVKGANNVCGA